MSRSRVAVVAFVIGALLAVGASSASALTLGTTSFPSGATPYPCNVGGFLVNTSTDSAYSYLVPAPGGLITSWSTNTLESTAGAPIGLLVLRPSGASYVVVGSDLETLPSPLPASGVATYTVSPPISASPGDVIGLYGESDMVDCYFGGGTIPAGDVAVAGAAPSTAPGTTYTPMGPGGAGFLINVSAELVQNQDASVTAGAAPTATVGGASVFGFTVANGGPANAPVTFSDTVPAGLSILGAAAGSGACSVAAATVSCTIDGLAPGTSAPVLIAVSAATAGSYTDTGSVSTTLTDLNPANNAAASTLTVSTLPVPSLPAPVLPTCTIVSLKKQTLAVAKLFLPALNCKVGKVTHKTSKTIKKNLIISTSPGKSASKPAGTKVNLVVSSGPPKKKKAKAKKKH